MLGFAFKRPTFVEGLPKKDCEQRFPPVKNYLGEGCKLVLMKNWFTELVDFVSKSSKSVKMIIKGKEMLHPLRI